MGLTGSSIFAIFIAFVAVLLFSILTLVRKPMDGKTKIFWLLLMILMPLLGVVAFWGYTLFFQKIEYKSN
jgi:hypothetical protein